MRRMEEEWLVGATTTTWNLRGQADPVGAKSPMHYTRFPMSLVRWTSYVAPVSKTQNGRFPCKLALRLKKVCYKISLSENRQGQSCKSFISMYKWLVEDVPFCAKIWRILQNADFQSIFACSASAVTTRKISSVNTNRKSTRHFPMSLRWTSYVAPKPPRGWLKNAVSKIWTISCDNSETV